MIDLNSLTRIFKKAETVAPTGPRVSAVVVHKSADMEPVKAALTAAGYSVENVEEKEDGTVVFKQAEDAESGTIVRLSENVVVVVKGADADVLKPYASLIGSDGYVEGLITATNALPDLIVKAVTEAKDQAGLTDSITKIIKAYSDFANAQATLIPVQAWKVSEGFTPVVKADEAMCPDCKGSGKCPMCGGTCKVDGKDCEACGATGKCAKCHGTGKCAPEAVEKAAEEKPVEEKPADPVKAEEKPAEEKPVEVAKADEPKADSLAPVMAALAALTEKLSAIESVQKSQAETLATTVTSLEAKVSEAVAKSDKTEQVLKGTVLAPPPPGDRTPAKAPVAKADDADDLGTGFFDTGYMRRNRR